LGEYRLHRSLALQAQQHATILADYSSIFRKNGISSANTLTKKRFTGSLMGKLRGYTGHSLRRGGASAAHAINVSLPMIVHWGLWKDASTALSYIDVTIQPDEGAFVFFSNLLPRTG